MKQTATLILVISISVFQQTYAQEHQKKEDLKIGRLYVSVNSGIFIMANDDYRKPYNDPIFKNIGGSVGVPIGRYSHIIGKITYIQGEAYRTQTTYSKNPETGELEKVSESQGDHFKRTQTISQIGIQRQLPITAGWSVFANTGLSFTHYKETLTEADENSSTDEGKGFIGGFIGGGIEKKLRNETLSVFVEGVYTHTNTLLSFFIGDQAGTSLSVGVRFYLPAPKNAQKYQQP